MSSIRLFILGSLAQRGEMHGHQLKLLAEEERVHMWTDISVGSLYGALKRLHSENLIVDVRTEQTGNFPARQVYAITDLGRRSLAALRSGGLSDFTLRPDPFDLALTRLDPDKLDALPDVIVARVALLHDLLDATVESTRRAGPHLSLTEKYALEHRERRLRAEIEWHDDLVAALPHIIADEATRTHPPVPDTTKDYSHP